MNFNREMNFGEREDDGWVVGWEHIVFRKVKLDGHNDDGDGMKRDIN